MGQIGCMSKGQLGRVDLFEFQSEYGLKFRPGLGLGFAQA